MGGAGLGERWRRLEKHSRPTSVSTHVHHGHTTPHNLTRQQPIEQMASLRRSLRRIHRLLPLPTARFLPCLRFVTHSTTSTTFSSAYSSTMAAVSSAQNAKVEVGTHSMRAGMSNLPEWMITDNAQAAANRQFPRLTGDAGQFDVAVVGGGTSRFTHSQ